MTPTDPHPADVSASVEDGDWIAAHLAPGRPGPEFARLGRIDDLLVASGGPEAAARGRAVAGVLHRLGVDLDTVAAGLASPFCRGDAAAPDALEAALEGGAAAVARGLERLFGGPDLSLVAAAGLDDREQVERVRMLVLSLVDDVRVVLVLLADRLVRLRDAARAAGPGSRLVAREARDVFAPMASRLGIWQLKWELEDLAFRVLEPATYAEIAGELAVTRESREKAIGAIIEELSACLGEAGIEADVRGRPKHIYSIWRKMRTKNLGFSQVRDVQAVRVIAANLEQCYGTLGVVHTRWRYIPEEFDDYIANPKGNDYRSLHTAVIGPGGDTLEIQIRTPEMHRHAELGAAAHWRYKEGGRPDAGVEGKIDWLRRLLETLDGAVPDPEGAASPGDIRHERIYVVTPRGRVLDLPRGATALDFAYRVHTDVGHGCRGAKVDGVIAPLTQLLRSGQQVEVLTGRSGGPSRDWLNPELGFLRSPRARAKVRQWFKQQDRERNVAAGRETFVRELKRLGVVEPDHAALLRRFNLKTFDDLLAAVGCGDVGTAQIASALERSGRLEEGPRLRPVEDPGEGSGEVRIGGVGDLMTQLAGCCRPLPPNPVVGYITRGRGVTVHRRDCGNVLRLEGEEAARLVDVDWNEERQRRYGVDVQLDAFDRKGLLRDVSAVVADEHVNVTAVDSSRDRRRHQFTIRLSLEVADLAELSRVTGRLAQVRNVIDVRRVR